MDIQTENYVIDLTNPDLTIHSGHLQMGGTNPAGVEINANNRYLTLDRKPWLPVMGEFHFSRYPSQGWRDELLKMKANGIQIAATYTFWIHHEEIEGQFIWSGDRDLRRFITLCTEVGLYAYPRIGPWAHGECRNGGFPDWLVARFGERTRSDDPGYLACVRRLYQEIAWQLRGMLWRDGGPVIGIQLENEMLNNAAHILTLKHLAQSVGLDVPLYTMTGWGPAQIPQDEVIPLFGGYPDAFWDRQVKEWSRGSRKHYFFTHLRDDNTIGADLNQAKGLPDQSYLERYPYATCELGGGMQVSYHRRPYIEPDDVAVLPLTRVGSGSNLPGYYMFHGGSQPLGELSTLQESQATGYWNDLPVISYDFQAPLGEYGQVNPSCHPLRRLHLFLMDYGSELAGMPALLPERMPEGLEDLTTLRWAVRSDGHSGFIFINNYQRIESLPPRPGVQLELHLKEETQLVPTRPVDIPTGAAMIWPFNLDLNGALLKHSTCQLVCRLEVDGLPCYVFSAYKDIPPEFVFDARTLAATAQAPGKGPRPLRLVLRGMAMGTGSAFTLQAVDGRRAQMVLLSPAEGLECWKAQLWGRERIFISPASLIFDGEQLRLSARKREDLWFAVYPELDFDLCQGWEEMSDRPDGLFTRYAAAIPEKTVQVTCHKVKPAAPARQVPLGPLGVARAPEDADFLWAEEWEVRLSAGALDGAHEVYLQIQYAGDAARAYLGKRLISDNFYNGRPWEIGLRRFAPDVIHQGLKLQFLPLRKDAPIYLPPEQRPAFGEGDEVLEVKSVQAEVEYRIAIGKC